MGNHPFWALLIIVLMVLPMVGAVAHILLKAFGRRGIDNTTSFPPTPNPERGENGGPKNEKNLPLDS